MAHFLLVTSILAGWSAFAQDTDPARTEALLRVKALAERFGQFEDPQVAVESLISLGRVTCRYDKPTAVTVLQSAASVLVGAELESEDHERVRGRLLRAANACDGNLADELFDATESPTGDPAHSAKTALSAAYSRYRDDPARAAEIAGSAVSAVPSMTNDDARGVTRFIQSLHDQDATVAGDLYLRALSTVEASPDGSLAALQALGNYPFRTLGPTDDATMVTTVGTVGVTDLATRRNIVSDEMAIAYLEAAAGILPSPVSTEGLQTYRYTLALQLAPHAAKLAPDLEPVFRGIVEGAGAALPKSVRLMAAQRLGKTMEELRKQSRLAAVDDGSRMMKASGHYRAGEFDKAREVAAEIEDEDVRERLERLAALGETLRAIDEAAPSIGELSPPLYSCLAYLSLAGRQFYEDGLPQDAASTLALAKIAAGKLDVAARPFLLLAAARLEAAIDVEAALATLTTAVTAFKTFDEEQEEHPAPTSRRLERSRTQVSDRGVWELLRANRSHSSVPLRISRIQGYSFEKVLPVFMETDPARLEAILENLRSERRLAEALAFAVELRFIH